MEIPQSIRDSTSEAKKLIYVYLSRVNSTTVGDISEELGLKRIELYPVLRSLDSDGHIEFKTSNDKVNLA